MIDRSSEASARLMVRPFNGQVENLPDLPAIPVSGRIELRAFVVTFPIGECVIPTLDSGRDDAGPYAFVSEGTVHAPGGFVLTIDVEPDEDLPSGCVMYLRRAADVPPQTAAVNLIVPAGDSLSLHFYADGDFECGGTSTPQGTRH